MDIRAIGLRKKRKWEMETPSWHTARDLVDMNFPHTNYKNETTLATVLNFFSTFKYKKKVIYIH